MIGVIPRANQLRAVEEFFELFKTPWELYRPENRYDVVLATADELPEIKTKLLIVYGAATKSIDRVIEVDPYKRHEQAILRDRDTFVPIYGELLTFVHCKHAACCVTVDSEIAGLKAGLTDCIVVRLGYDLFEEIGFLLCTGQLVEHAHIPTLDIHISMLRNCILNEGIPLLEIPPTPAGKMFIVCLTHDIDFTGIRNHKFDHTMWGFLYRSTLGALQKLFRGRLSLPHLFATWRAVASLPFVYLGWLRDFWEPFEWYLEVEEGLNATYFLIPFQGRTGERVPGTHSSRRAAAYNVDDLSESTAMLIAAGCEVGVHGIDAWHSVERGREEWSKIARMTGEATVGIRIHWLLQDSNTFSVLEKSGYAYDSSVGYNETIGYRVGTGQVYRPLSAQALLELPLHIQDGALFYAQRLNLSGQEAQSRCQCLIDNARRFGGVLTVLWHDRSHAPERFWGDFYVWLLNDLKSSNVWFASAGQAVSWFRKRREVRFERLAEIGQPGIRLHYEGEDIQPPLKIRMYTQVVRGASDDSFPKTYPEFSDVAWNGKPAAHWNPNLGQKLMSIPDAPVCSPS